MRTFVPQYQDCYGVTRAQWRRLSTPEKLKVLWEFRQRCAATCMEVVLVADNPNLTRGLAEACLPRPFVPYTWEDEMAHRQDREIRQAIYEEAVYTP